MSDDQQRPGFEVQMYGPNQPELRIDGSPWFSCSSLRVEVGSDLTADPNNRPGRIIIETGSVVATALANKLGVPVLRAPPRDEFLKRMEAIEETLRRLYARER